MVRDFRRDGNRFNQRDAANELVATWTFVLQANQGHSQPRRRFIRRVYPAAPDEGEQNAFGSDHS